VLNIQTFHACIGDDDADQCGMVQLFVNQGEKKLQTLAQECKGGRSEEWRQAAHFIKSAAATLGAERLKKLCEDAQGKLLATAAERTALLDQINAAFKELLGEFSKMGIYP
jgi:HPt (histidine-containing phosphotransfer) domain-containing protein